MLFFTISFASEHGIYMRVVKNVSFDYNVAKGKISMMLDSTGFKVINDLEVATPDLVREDESEHTGYQSGILLVTSDEYTRLLTSLGNKYLVASFIRVGFHEDNEGLHITIADIETINRIVFNDLDDDQYLKIVEATKKYKSKLINTIHSAEVGENVKEAMEPIRDDEDLRDGSKDMFMMVGPMTFFDDEDQFPVIMEVEMDNPENAIEQLISTMKSNLEKFEPLQDDIEYRWSANGKIDLKWQIVGKNSAPDSRAVLLGITRPRTEALSFQIAGEKRSDDNNLSPGMDHVTAYPIEILILAEDGKLRVLSLREMFRMDMYFWDAGKMAFMNYMQMPGTLDESIKKALFNIEED